MRGRMVRRHVPPAQRRSKRAPLSAASARRLCARRPSAGLATVYLRPPRFGRTDARRRPGLYFRRWVRAVLAELVPEPVSGRTVASALEAFHPLIPALVSRFVRRADAGSEPRLAPDRRRRIDLAAGAHRLGQDARRVSGGARSADVSARAWTARAAAGALRFAAQGARRRHREEPARADRRHCGAGRLRAGCAHSVPRGRGALGRHAGARERARFQRSAERHSDHDARVAVPVAHVERARRGCARSRR